jgi:hypothetical protein
MPAGRPSLYNKKLGKMVFMLSLAGCTDQQMSDALDVALSTFNNWKNEHPEFLAQIRKGKEQANAKVAKAMYKRANGIRYEEVTHETDIVTDTDEDGNKTQREVPKSVKRVTKFIPPDVSAGKFWLVNKQPEVWRDKTEVDTKNQNINMSVEPTPEEAQKIKDMLDKSI